MPAGGKTETRCPERDPKKEERHHQGQVFRSLENKADRRRCQQGISHGKSSYAYLLPVPGWVFIFLPQEESLGGRRQYGSFRDLKEKNTSLKKGTCAS